MQNQLRNVTIFAGIGGMQLGLTAGLGNCVTHHIHEPNKDTHYIYRKCSEIVHPNIDSLINAGRGNKTDILSGRYRKDKDWDDWTKAIRGLKPTYVVIEGLANMRCKQFVRIFKDLWSLGYNAEWHVIPTSEFGGGFRGSRVWIVAHPISNGLAPNREPEEAPRILGEQLLSHGTFDEYRIRTPRFRPTATGTVCGQPGLLRRDDGVSRRVDYARIRLLTDDVPPYVSEFVGYALRRHLDGESMLVDENLTSRRKAVRDVSKKHLILETQKTLDKMGLHYTAKNSGLHFVIHHPSTVCKIHFWPTSGRWICHETDTDGYGLPDALEIFRDRVDL